MSKFHTGDRVVVYDLEFLEARRRTGTIWQVAGSTIYIELDVGPAWKKYHAAHEKQCRKLRKKNAK
jgi:hypothetical protein